MTTIVQYASVSDFIAREMKDDVKLSPEPADAQWDAGVSGVEALRRAQNGDPGMAASCDAEISRFALAQGGHVRRVYEDNVAGTRVLVPAYLASNPRCMRRRVKRDCEARHVSVYVAIESSAGVGAETLLQRGSAILALLGALQAARVAVDVTLCMGTLAADNSDRWTVIPIESKPLDLSVAGFAIAHPAFARSLAYRLVRRYCGENFGCWARAYSANGYSTDKAIKAVRAALGLSPGDIFVAPAALGDPILSDPGAWVRERVTQVLGGEAS